MGTTVEVSGAEKGDNDDGNERDGQDDVPDELRWRAR
jgi:hypothetical protein